MAYLDLSEFSGEAVAAPAALQGPATLSALEWQVVGIAQRDRLSSLEAPSRWSNLLALFFGRDRASPRLADPRLEALRRVAVHAWHKGDAIPADELAGFHAAGFSFAQLQLLLAQVGHAAIA